MADQPQKSVGRSICAVLLGFVVVVALSLGTDAALRAAGIYPALGKRMSDGWFVVATLYRTAFGIVGSYITARLAPHSPMKHTMIGAVIGFLLATFGAVATWNRDFGPHWYPLALILTAFPTAWIGAKLRLAQVR